jgi:hypothetical protein
VSFQDDRLRDALLEVEAHAPTSSPPPIPPRSTPRWALVLTAAAAAVATVGVAVYFGTLNDRTGAPTLTPTPSASAVPSTDESPEVTSSPTASVSTTPTLTPSTEPTESAAAGWTIAASFSEFEQWRFPFDATTWSGGFAAVGLRMETFPTDIGPYLGEPTLWVSPDGRDWNERPLNVSIPEGEDDRVEIIVSLPDGRLMVVRRTRAEGAWVSSDGVAWEPIDLGIDDTLVVHLERGPHGYVLIGTTPDDVGQIWHSENGLDWSLSREVLPNAGGPVQLNNVGAGPEGFVVTGVRRPTSVGGTDRPLIMASGDGREWFDAPAQESLRNGDHPYDVGPLGNDWVATGFGAAEAENRPVVWRSANGLDWTRHAGPTDPSGRTAFHATDLAGAGGHVVISPALFQISGAFQFPTIAWSTNDGLTWEPIPPDESYVTEVVSDGEVVIAVGRIGRGTTAAFWITSPLTTTR